MPPPRVRLATPVDPMKPDGVAIPNCTVAWSMSPQVQPKVSHPHSSNQRLTAHTHMSEGERPQERTQRGGRVGPVEDPTQRPVPQQCHVVDAVGAGDHAGDQGGHLPTGVGALVRRDIHMPIRQHRQPGRRPLRRRGRASRTSQRRSGRGTGDTARLGCERHPERRENGPTPRPTVRTRRSAATQQTPIRPPAVNPRPCRAAGSGRSGTRR